MASGRPLVALEMFEIDQAHGDGIEFADDAVRVAFLECNARDAGLQLDSDRRNAHSYDLPRLREQLRPDVVPGEPERPNDLQDLVDVVGAGRDPDVQVAGRPRESVKSDRVSADDEVLNPPGRSATSRTL